MKKLVVSCVTKIFGANPQKGMKLVRQGLDKETILEKTGLGVGVNQASFSVNEGELLVIMGLSGSGKSTLVRCINRLIEPTAGKVFVDGVDVTSLNAPELRELRQKKLGMVFQNFALLPHKTIYENVEFGLDLMGENAAKKRKISETMLAQVGLEGWGDSYPSQLSGGMQQRVGLARALALDPDILLMDEAFSALDPLIRRDMQDELIKLQMRMHKTIIFISHDLDEALKLGDRIVLMKDGEIVQIGPPEDILTAPANDYVRRFVEDVDATKVLTAENVMKKAEAVAYTSTDGPRAALRKMRKNAISSLFLLGKSNRLLGIVTAYDAAEAVKTGNRKLEEIMKPARSVSIDTPALELYPMMSEATWPLAVVKEDDEFLGVVVRGSLVAAIAEYGPAPTL
ncbi:betaine/proline/choline family ABC transporter ATP-binding protein [Pseudodesulfovibrio sp. JC047]|uniref:quaternary amine ABC transporter ATP-binding protein n=1 Tax=Pseudodesulfovibrio sp. JC047 TaxID=2683199 RepID=UPI0013D4613D|nr:glycine betaine/L-proline ABC transporter ATP-binding protein [Pseudodesulfovibrio sp. JC047]NDV20804.1 betaine/proline/choline family ABC transporter ATP-binding protein [Pseudodesulfovibrio sp. JC047]